MSTQDSGNPSISKPNPYVIVETDANQVDKRGGGGDPYEKKETVVFKYPKSKIFVGGLDFRLS